VVAIIYCKVHAKVLWKWVLKHGKAGQRDTSEYSWEPGMRRTESLASAQRLRPHGMLMPYFKRTRLGQGPAGTHENRTKREQEQTGRILDIMAKESYLLQGTIYSNRQTIVSYYNRTRIGQ